MSQKVEEHNFKNTVDFFTVFEKIETSSVHFMGRESDISQETIDELASKLINYGKDSKEKDHF